MTIWIASIIILLDMYALSLEVAAITFCLFAVIYLIFLRFSPKDSFTVLFTPIMFRFNIPYIMPIGVGLLRKAYSVVAVVCGTVVYYFIDGIKQNSSTLIELASNKDAEITAKFNVIIGQIFNRPEMYLVIVIFALSSLCVYFIRRIKADHAWTLAIITGGLVQICGLFIGYIAMGITDKAIGLIIGSIFSILIGFVLEFLFMNLDYARTERVQFEDDDYYYYVKAVPKIDGDYFDEDEEEEPEIQTSVRPERQSVKTQTRLGRQPVKAQTRPERQSVKTQTSEPVRPAQQDVQIDDLESRLEKAMQEIQE